MPSPRQNAQQGKTLIKAAIVELLDSQKGARSSRSEIEDALGIGSTYQGVSGGASYEGGLAAMLLSELAEEGKVRRQKNGKWMYTSSK
jgi:hypothetical protein